MRASLFLISLALSSAGCSDGPEYAERAGISPAATSSAAAPPAAQAVTLEQESERYDFAYSWPAAASEERELAAYFQSDADQMRAQVEKEASEDWDVAEGQEWTPRQHSASLEWKVVADLPRFLSLSGNLATYSGGAHGMYGLTSLVWDREDRRRLDGTDLFNSPVALEQALGNRLCDGLNTARAKRRGSQVDEGSDDMFDKCPGIDEATVLIGTSNGRTFDRITVYFGPYVAGPYAEGAYELDFDVTASVLDAVKPEYADTFRVRS